jgi:ABC-type multidrug transport system fused ATPase/permease subunit
LGAAKDKLHHTRRTTHRLGGRNRTTFIVAHRLSTLRGVDRVLVFKDGSIVEDGTIAELINRPGGHYARLHALQSGVIEDPAQA